MVVRKMKDKCKDAARMRREKERAEFVELAKLLPLPASTTSQLDKASIIRLTSSYLSMRAAFPDGLGDNWGKNDSRSWNKSQYQSTGSERQYSCITDVHQQQRQNQVPQHQQPQQQTPIKELGSLLLQTLDGFVFALQRGGKIMYVSETASVHLGLPQIDLTGSTIFDYVHPLDHDDLREVLTLTDLEMAQLRDLNTDVTELGRSFCVRMKCILPKRNAGLVSSGYKAIHCNGYLKVRRKQSLFAGADRPTESNLWESYALVAVGHSLVPTASTEIKLTGNSFMFRANLDLRFSHVEAHVADLLGYDPSEMTGTSLYQFVHLDDVKTLEHSHRSLIDKGQMWTKYYRIMKKGGGAVWVQSHALLVNIPRSMPKPEHIVCVCIIIADDYHETSCSIHTDQADLSLRSIAQYAGAKSQSTVSSYGSSSVEMSLIQRAGALPTPKTIRKDRQSTSKKGRKITLRGNQEKSICSNPGEIKLITRSCEISSSYQCPISRVTTTSAPDSASIGTMRRSSDDTCSIVSSIASTGVSSSGSNYPTNEFSISYHGPLADSVSLFSDNGGSLEQPNPMETPLRPIEQNLQYDASFSNPIHRQPSPLVSKAETNGEMTLEGVRWTDLSGRCLEQQEYHRSPDECLTAVSHQHSYDISLPYTHGGPVAQLDYSNSLCGQNQHSSISGGYFHQGECELQRQGYGHPIVVSTYHQTTSYASANQNAVYYQHMPTNGVYTTMSTI